MNAEERREILIDYAEGVLTPEQKREVDVFLLQSAADRAELQIIQAALEALQNDQYNNVPEHYFTNFLPRLRTNIQSGSIRSLWPLPRLVQSMLQPAIVIVILISFVGIYQFLKPESSRTAIYSLINEFEPDEMSSIVNEASVLSSGSSENNGEPKIETGYFTVDLSHYQTESDVLAILEENELEKIVEHLENRAIR